MRLVRIPKAHNNYAHSRMSESRILRTELLRPPGFAPLLLLLLPASIRPPLFIKVYTYYFVIIIFALR